MKKNVKTILLLATILVAGSVNAQSPKECSADKYKVETNTFWNNWFISVGAGGQVYIGDNDSQGSFGKRIAPALDIAVGKWFTPGIGLRIEYSGLQAKGFGFGEYAYGTKNDNGVYRQKWNMAHFHGDVLFNLSNMFYGYKENRLYNLIPYVGFGAVHSFDDAATTNELATTIGIINKFRLSNALDLNVEARGTLIHDRFDGEFGGNGKEGLAAVTVGLTYKFKQRGWNKPCVKTTGISEEDMQRVREQLNQMMRENQNLKDELAAAKNKKPQTIIEKETTAASRIILFTIGQSSLNKGAKVNLGYLAEAIKKAPKDKIFTITGYADNKTGSKAINEKLSKERAETVRDALVNDFGVDTAQLKVDYKGGVDNMFYDDASLSRVVIAE